MRPNDLFENEILRLNVPFNDFSFLDDLVNNSSASLNDCLPGGALEPLGMGGSHDQAESPSGMQTPISNHGQPGDRVSGLESLRAQSGGKVSESGIPPGLFIAVGEIKTGYLGKV